MQYGLASRDSELLKSVGVDNETITDIPMQNVLHTEHLLTLMPGSINVLIPPAKCYGFTASH